MDIDPGCIALLLHACYDAGAVDMAAYYMAAEPALGRHSPLQVHQVAGLEMPQVGTAQGFGHNIGCKAFCIHSCDCKTHAVHCNAVAGLGSGKNQLCSYLDAARVSPQGNMAYCSCLLNYSCKHFETSYSIRISSPKICVPLRQSWNASATCSAPAPDTGPSAFSPPKILGAT